MTKEKPTIYIASSFRLIAKVEAAARALERAGFTITEKWWARAYQSEGLGTVGTQELKKHYDSLSPDEFYRKPETEKSFGLDFRGVMYADYFLFVADDEPRKFNGANVELGIAIGTQRRCFSIGALENSVLYYPVTQCRDIAEVIEWIKTRPEKLR